MNKLPWWLISVLTGLAASFLLGLAFYCPFPWMWPCLIAFLLVGVLTLLHNPLYFYRRLASYLVGSWLTVIAASGIEAFIQTPNVIFQLAVSDAGPYVHIVIAVLVPILLYLDYKRTLSLVNQFEAQNPETLGDWIKNDPTGKLALQLMQSQTHFFSVDTSNLTKKEQAAIAHAQLTKQREEMLWKQRLTLAMILAFTFVITVAAGLTAWLAVPETYEVPVVFTHGSLPIDSVRATIRFGNKQTTVIGNGTSISLPASATFVDQIEIVEPDYLSVMEKGPFPTVRGESLKVEVFGEPPPLDEPHISFKTALPAATEVQDTVPSFSPYQVSLRYHNLTERKLNLFLLDLTSFYENHRPYWTNIHIMPRTQNHYENFKSGSSGMFAFVLREGAGPDLYRGYRNVFYSKTPLVEVQEDDKGDLELIWSEWENATN